MSQIARIVSTEQFSDPRARSLILIDLYERSLQFVEIVFAKLIELGHIHAFPVRLLAAEYQYPVFSMITQYQIMQFDGQDTSGIEQLMKDHVSFFFHKIKK